MTQKLINSQILAQLIDGSPIPSFFIDMRHKVMHWNIALEALSGIKREEMVGTDMQWKAFYIENRPVMADLVINGATAEEIEKYYPDKCTRSGLIAGAFEAEDFFPDLGKAGKWLRFTASPIRSSSMKLVGVIETLEDITERKEAEKSLRESEENFRSLFEGANDAAWVHDLKGNILTSNKAAAKLVDYPVDELIGKNIKTLICDESLRIAREVRSKLLKHQLIENPYEQKLIRKDGSEVICMITSNLITLHGEPTCFQNIARDVTQERQMQENLRYYLQQITRAQEEERKRIARELHDDTAQVLTSLLQQLDYFVRKKPRLAEKEAVFFKDMQTQLNRGVIGVHRFIQDLRPSLLDDLGLIPALRSLVKNMQDSDAIKIHLEIIGEERRFTPEVESLLFRIVQEALNNIRRHAQASEASVTIEFVTDKINVSVTDNGRGFELVKRVDDLPRSGKLGLVGMQERVRLLDGTLGIKSALGKGTTIIIEIPK